MNKRTFKRIKKLHEEGVSLGDTFKIILTLSNNADETVSKILELLLDMYELRRKETIE